MKSLSSIIGWLLLAAVLAVPSFLFYNWWTKNKQQSTAEISQGQAPANLFPSQDKVAAAPPARSTAAPAALMPQTPGERHPDASAQPPAAPARQAAQPQIQAQPQAQKPAAAQQAVSTAPAQALAVAQSTSAAASVAVSTRTKSASYFSPKGDRDPTLSPEDYRHIKEVQMQREEEEARRRMADRNRPREATCDSRVHLQGIVGNAAIVNGDMYYVGQTAAGAKITKIGSNYILVECKGKKYRKVLQ
jgi:cytoskeletal protein RodZ